MYVHIHFNQQFVVSHFCIKYVESVKHVLTWSGVLTNCSLLILNATSMSPRSLATPIGEGMEH